MLVGGGKSGGWIWFLIGIVCRFNLGLLQSNQPFTFGGTPGMGAPQQQQQPGTFNFTANNNTEVGIVDKINYL